MPLFTRGSRIYLATRTALFAWDERGTLLRVLSMSPSRDTGNASRGFVSPGPAGLLSVANKNWVAVVNLDLQVLWKARIPNPGARDAPLVTGSGVLAVPTSRGLLLVQPPL